ncbi:CBS domain-containing protein [Methanohalophilus levihalophilus]|uniref:CBS domain-containing protein n=1 Tax=Methanohalophilus levihalophilus TaxID=1431282 RepID=UPI001AE275F6|nr:CBS domain-containing protein [Methanohalophilus levihalophilus]MBP2029931.1 CBS domain-containing protein [Methanohalophilus levihalophilus]
MKIADIMSSPVYAIGPEEPVSHARNLMLRHKISTLIVAEEEKMVGIVTKSDIGNRLAQTEPMWRRRPIDKVPIRLVMTEDPLVTIYPDASIEQAVELLLENNFNNLPVVDGDLLGIVTIGDILRYIGDQPGGIKISEVLEGEPVIVHRHHTINHVIDEIEANEVSKVLVENDAGNIVGMISTRDLALSMFKDSEGKLPGKSIKMARRPTAGGEKTYRYVKDVPLVAEDIMVELDGIVQYENTLAEAAKLMVEENLTGVPVENEGKIVGMLSRHDVIREAK